MNNKLIPFVLAVSLITLLTSCDALLNPGSIFSALDKPNTSTVVNATGQTLLDALAQNAGSDTFYSSLSKDDIAKLNASLTAILSDPNASAAMKSQAALAKAELNSQTNPLVKATINDMAETLTSLLDSSSSQTLSVADVTSSLTASLKAQLEGKSEAEQTQITKDFLDSMDQISSAYSTFNTVSAPENTVKLADVQTCLVAEVFTSITDLYSDNTSAAKAVNTLLDQPSITKNNVGTLAPNNDVTALTTALNTNLDTVVSVTDATGMTSLSDTVSNITY